MNFHDVIIYPVVTEKTESLSKVGKNSNRYTFRVADGANKELIRQALHKIYKVNAVKINTAIVAGKQKRFGQHPSKKPSWKRAVVTLAPGESLNLGK